MANKRVMLGMSGGVDSSAAALLLLEEGYELVGATLLLTQEAEKSVEDAAAVCRILGVEHKIYDLKQEFNQYVVDNFVSEYLHGRTPNPCIRCNRYIKFGEMLRLAQSEGCEHIATGHYARIEELPEGGFALLRSRSTKDQSYALWPVAKETLGRVLLPVADWEKPSLRELVKRAGLPVYAKPDSQDICFLPNGDYAGFVERYAKLEPRKGSFVDENGATLGMHNGVLHYTIGQRKGLGGGFLEPMYVVKIIPEENRVVLGREGRQYSRRASCSGLNLLVEPTLSAGERVSIKTRYSAKLASARVEINAAEGRAEIEFDEPQRAVTPGQSAVIYKGERVLGGAIIDSCE